MVKLALKGITDLIGDLNEEAIHAIYGASQVGKTTFMLQCAYNYSAVTGRNALYYDTEGGGKEFVKLWDEKFRKLYPKAKEIHVRMRRNWMDILEDHGKTVKLKTSDNGRMSVNVIEYKDSAVEKFCKDNDIGLVIYDSITMPMKAFGNSQENFPARNYAQSLWLNGMLDVIDRCNCIVFTNHHSCHDIETKAVTKRGFIPYNELSLEDEVLTLDEGGNTEWNKIQAVQIYDYNGELVRIKGKSVDQLVTPNHRILHIDKNVQEYVLAEDVNRHGIAIPRAAQIESEKIEEFDKYAEAHSYAYLLGWYVAEGYLQIKKSTTGYDYTESRLCLNADDIPHIEPALKRLGVNYWIIQQKVTNSMEHLICFSTKDKRGSGNDMTVELYDCGRGSHNKQIPAIIKHGSDDMKKAFLLGYLRGDGHKDPIWQSWSFSTVSHKLALDIVELVSSIGIGITLHYKKNSVVGFGGGDGYSWIGTITNKNKAWAIKTETVPYTGKVWCLTVKNSNFAIVRNGRVCFSGNSKNPADMYSVEQMAGGSAVQYFSKVILFMKKIDAKGARTYRRIKLARYFNKPPNTFETLVNLTNNGYVDATEDQMNEDKKEAQRDARAKK